MTLRDFKIEAVIYLVQFAPYYLTELSVLVKSKQSQLILIIPISFANFHCQHLDIIFINMAINHPHEKMFNHNQHSGRDHFSGTSLTLINFCRSRRRAIVNYLEQSRSEQFWQEEISLSADSAMNHECAHYIKFGENKDHDSALFEAGWKQCS